MAVGSGVRVALGSGVCVGVDTAVGVAVSSIVAVASRLVICAASPQPRGNHRPQHHSNKAQPERQCGLSYPDFLFTTGPATDMRACELIAVQDPRWAGRLPFSPSSLTAPSSS